MKAKRNPRIYFDVDQIIYPGEEEWDRMEIDRNVFKRKASWETVQDTI